MRAFAIYIVILGTLIWFTLDNAIERLNDGMRQSAESVLVDTANILASYVEDQIDEQGLPEIVQLQRVFDIANQRNLAAQIYQVTKTNVDSQVYITDVKGIVVYNSNGQDIGEDYSRWRDVSLTLEGKYGARTSYIDSTRTEPDDPKAMVIAAPIRHQQQIVGVLSVLKPIDALEGHLVTETQQLQRYAFALLLLALVIGYLLSVWFTRSLNRIANYANDMAEGKRVESPKLHDNRLNDLTESISYMRSQLDGKEYVENYIHSLTHELKTPITSIRGAVELITEDMSAEDRNLFIKNIDTSNNRMSRLVERMLSLAKLEGLTELVDQSHFDVKATINRLVQERLPTIQDKQIIVNQPKQSSFECYGDKILIGQAIANLIDNAIRFCTDKGVIEINLRSTTVNNNPHYEVTIFNEGEAIPDFALDKLYDRFFSLPPSEKEYQSSKSTGLGLSFVAEIMKLHQGKVEVKNTKNGVTATLHWPQR